MAAGRPRARTSRDFRLLWAGQSVSQFGSQVTLVALPLVALKVLDASTFAVGVLAAAETVPFLLVGLPAGAWVDRWAKRSVLLAADAGRAAVLVSVPVANVAGVLTMAQLYLVAIIGGVLTVFFDVAYQSYLPFLVDAEDLVQGNGRLATTDAMAQVGGPGLGGVLVGAIGAANAVLTDAASFVASFATVAAIGTREAPRPVADRRKLRTEVAEGLRWVLAEPRVRRLAACTGTSNLFSSMGFAVFVVYLVRGLHLSAGRLGLVFALGNVGGLVGAVLAGWIGRGLGTGPAIAWSMAVASVGPLLWPLARGGGAASIAVVATGSTLFSLGGVVYNIHQVSLRQVLCPPRLQGRMNASVRFLIWGTMPIGGVLGGALGTVLGLRPTLWLSAAGGCLSVLWIVRSPVTALRVAPPALGDEEPASVAAGRPSPPLQ